MVDVGWLRPHGDRESLCTLLDNVTLHLVKGLRGQIGMGKNLTFFFNFFFTLYSFSLGINVSENMLK